MQTGKEKLEELYVVKRFSTWKIAQILNVSQMTVCRWLKGYDIKTRSYSETAKMTLNGFKEGDKNPNWSGDDVSYQALHTWVRKRLGTPKKCSHCGSDKKKKYEWANISKEYKRDLKDWVRLCTSCHRLFDNF